MVIDIQFNYNNEVYTGTCTCMYMYVQAWLIFEL